MRRKKNLANKQLARILAIEQSPVRFSSLYRPRKSGLTRKEAVALFNCGDDMTGVSALLLLRLRQHFAETDIQILLSLRAIQESLPGAIRVMEAVVKRRGVK